MRGVYAGVPVRYICSIEELVNKRIAMSELSVERDNYELSELTVKECWKKFEMERKEV